MAKKTKHQDVLERTVSVLEKLQTLAYEYIDNPDSISRLNALKVEVQTASIAIRDARKALNGETA